MKKISLLIIIAAGTGLLLSSCSRIENISVSKRHYRSGYTVDLGSRKPDVSTPKVSETATPITTPSSSSYVADKSAMTPEKGIQAPAPVVLTSQVETKKQSHKHASGNLYASTRNISTIKEDIQDVSLGNYAASLPDVNYAASSASSSSSSAPMWVIILFAILIPPLGVALKFGIVDKFWISSLLTLLFWLPGAIYSVIVVTE